MITVKTGDYFSYDGKIVKAVKLQTTIDKVLWLRPLDNSGPDILVIENDEEFQQKAKPLPTITEE
jgi:hypothetical protein